jgi:hypothetical protein
MPRSVCPRHRPAARRAALALQTLEGRDVPAGNVFASLSATGVLTLVGDNAANAVTIRITGTSVTVAGDPGTTVDGLPLVSAPRAVQAVQAAMNGGNDVVRIDPTANFFVPGSVAVNLGEGTNSLSLQTAGRIVLGSLAVAGGTGNDAIAVAGGFGTGSIITGAASIGTGGGANAVTLRRVAVGGPVAVATGDGADTLTIDASTFFNTFTANLGAGNDAIRIAQARGSATPVEFRGTVSVHAGVGNDTLLLGRAGAAGGDVNSRVIFHGGVVSGDAAGTFNLFDTVTTQRTGPVTLIGWA